MFRKKVIPIIGILLVFGFVALSLTGCDNGSTDNGPTGGDWPPPSVTELTANTWEDGELEAADDIEWFKFTATAATQYIHFYSDDVSYAYIQLFNNAGDAQGSEGTISDMTQYTVTSGQTYYIKISVYGSYTGEYQIGFTNSIESPPIFDIPVSGIIPLTEDTWTEGTIASSEIIWFSFTATANPQYIHFMPGSVSVTYLQVVNALGGRVGARTYIGGSDFYISRPLETGENYYVLADGWSGDFQIAFNDSSTPPGIDLPDDTESTLISSTNTWVDGDSNNPTWYRFSATAGTNYIHFNFITGVGATVTVYNSTGHPVGAVGQSVRLSPPYLSRELTAGTYYIYVPNGYYNGDYQIAFSTSDVPPAIDMTAVAAPATNITAADTWVSGSVTYDGRTWFSFSSNTDTQYIHFRALSGWSIFARIYDASGNAVGIPSEIVGNNSSTHVFFETVVPPNMYYVKVEGLGYSSTFDIAFSASETPPSP